MDNRRIADRLDAFAALLELGEANPYTARAYRRAAETIRATPAPVAELVRDGRVRELRGIGPGIEARLRELVETGTIAGAGRARARARSGARRPGALSRAQREALDRDRAGARRPDAGRAARGGGGRPPADRPRHRAEDRGAAPRGSRRARPSRDRSAHCCSTAPGSSWAPSPRRSTGKRPAMCAAGATRASSWPWSAPRPTRPRCWSASRRCRRSSR